MGSLLNFRRMLVFGALFCIVLPATFAQKGQKEIDKAALLLEKGSFEKAQKQLNKARKYDYGARSNDWAYAYNRIFAGEARILEAMGAFDSALVKLDSVVFGLGYLDISEDYLRVNAGVFGTENFRKALLDFEKDFDFMRYFTPHTGRLRVEDLDLGVKTVIFVPKKVVNRFLSGSREKYLDIYQEWIMGTEWYASIQK